MNRYAAAGINADAFKGKRIIRSHRQGTRGVRADVLYLDEGVDALVSDTHAWQSLRASLNGSQHAEIIRA